MTVFVILALAVGFVLGIVYGDLVRLFAQREMAVLRARVALVENKLKQDAGQALDGLKKKL